MAMHSLGEFQNMRMQPPRGSDFFCASKTLLRDQSGPEGAAHPPTTLVARTSNLILLGSTATKRPLKRDREGHAGIPEPQRLWRVRTREQTRRLELVVDLCAFAGAAVVHIVIAADSDENAS